MQDLCNKSIISHIYGSKQITLVNFPLLVCRGFDTKQQVPNFCWTDLIYLFIEEQADALLEITPNNIQNGECINNSQV